MKNIHWIQGDQVCESPLFRRSFMLERLPVSAELEICGLGYFLLYVNGQRVGNQEFMPAFTGYSSVLGCETTYPVWEERTAYRSLYLTFDLLPFLKKGENVIGVQLGNGWYHQTERTAEGKFIFGFPKLRYELHMTDASGRTVCMESDRETLWKPGEITKNNLFYGETHDLRLYQEEWCCPGADLSGWVPSRPSHAPETLLTKQDCPADRVLRRIRPVLLKERQGKRIYDCGENLAGWVEVRCLGRAGEEIVVRYSEEISENGMELDFVSAGGKGQIQEDRFICSGEETTVHPKFCWHGFRYFEMEGPGEPVMAAVVCTDAPATGSFCCSDPVLNWLYDSYIRTQTANYHNCIPSDCPHRERLGYTGDGQLTAETAMLTMDTRGLYEKWYQDILDSQGVDTGHVPHTAPFLGGGGGPGGWGGAIYQIPMSYYHVYGDTALMEQGYPAIKRWLEYMEAHSENGLVVKEEEGGWCLGEWCAPETEKETLPPPFVNTWYYIQGLEAAIKIADLLKKERPDWAEERLRRTREAFVQAFYDERTGDFCKGAGAANAFALRIGLGTERTKENLLARYRVRGSLDTGIFGTPILLEWLFDAGEGDLAYQLLTSEHGASFAGMMKGGATTLWETWEGKESHNHPMFGSVVKLLFTEILGIHQKEGSCGFSDWDVHPADIRALQWAEGTLRTVSGEICVRWTRGKDGNIQIERMEGKRNGREKPE